VVRASDGGPDSHGFCLLNNISIAAAYAMSRHRDRVKRVAIVDFGPLNYETHFFLSLLPVNIDHS